MKIEKIKRGKFLEKIMVTITTISITMYYFELKKSEKRASKFNKVRKSEPLFRNMLHRNNFEIQL